MFTGTPEHIRHFYEVENVLKSYTVYSLKNVSDSNRIKLTGLVRLEPFRGKSNTSGVRILLRGRERNRWAKNSLTGLRPTSMESVFYGDHLINGKKSLLLFRLEDNSRVLIIDYFNGFYPNHMGILNAMIQNHNSVTK
jgi:hypothetical protein